jgi:copper(I)-binding protein
LQNDKHTVLAQQEFFIRLGNMAELQPDEHFVALMNLGNALIEGDLHRIQIALAYYRQHDKLIYEHVEFLRRAFANAEVSFQDPALLKYQAPNGQHKCDVMISIVLERAGKVAFISSDQTAPSEVHAFTRGKNGIVTLESVKEDPRLLLKQISRIIRLPDVIEPPPLSII